MIVIRERERERVSESFGTRCILIFVMDSTAGFYGHIIDTGNYTYPRVY